MVEAPEGAKVTTCREQVVSALRGFANEQRTISAAPPGLKRSAVGQKNERDHQRFRKLVRGKVKSNLAKYISRGEMIGQKGNDLVRIPLPQIDIPQFRYGTKEAGG